MNNLCDDLFLKFLVVKYEDSVWVYVVSGWYGGLLCGILFMGLLWYLFTKHQSRQNQVTLFECNS